MPSPYEGEKENQKDAVNIFSKTLQDKSLIPPCQASCPLKMDIREYVDLVAQGKIMEALQVIRSKNPFPSICAYVCTSPCEESCRRGGVDNPIAIRALKRFAVEFGGDRMIEAETAEIIYNEKVAIVGSGPAGLSCAYYLCQRGYPVTIFEAHSEVGGMLRVGIPRYRLPREVIDVEVKRLQQMGVEIRTNTRISSLEVIFELGYEAVFVTIGAHQGMRLGIEGEDSPGVIDGATFLREVNLGLKPSLGKKVAVIGGGNVAIDAARTALRLGAEEVHVVYRRTREEMPAEEDQVNQALEENVHFEFLTTPVKIKRTEEGLKVTHVEMQLGEPDDSGRRKPVPIEGSEFEGEYNNVITAIGQAPQPPEDFHVRMGRGSTIQVDPVTLTTNRTGVFAGGDAVTGPSTVVEALAAGRAAASRIDDYLQQRYPFIEKENREHLKGDLLPRTIELIKKLERRNPPVLSPQERTDFKPLELVYNWEDAVIEARRCLWCGMGAEILFQEKCPSCLNCLRICPYEVPYLDGDGKVVIPQDQCQACGLCITECPAKAIILRKPYDRRRIAEEINHVARSADTSGRGARPFIIGFCCQYGLFGTGTLSGLWRRPQDNFWIIPVFCAAKVEADHLLQAFEIGAEGVFVAGCGEQCARENTAEWVRYRTEKVKRSLEQLGWEKERLQSILLSDDLRDPAEALDKFVDQVGRIYLAAAIIEEVKG